LYVINKTTYSQQAQGNIFVMTNFERAFPEDSSARDNFNKAFNKYFTGKNSDEIYREVALNNN